MSPAKKSARGATRRTPRERARAPRAVQPRPSRRATPARVFPQRAQASPKQIVLFDLMRARATVLAAIQGLIDDAADQPLAPGKWSARLTILHLVARDRVRLRELEAMLRGTEPSWRGIAAEEMDRINAVDLATLSHHPWAEARRLLHATRHELIEAIESVPDEPGERWAPEHPFGWMLHQLPPHDLHHAATIKRWRSERGGRRG